MTTLSFSRPFFSCHNSHNNTPSDETSSAHLLSPNCNSSNNNNIIIIVIIINHHHHLVTSTVLRVQSVGTLALASGPLSHASIVRVVHVVVDGVDTGSVRARVLAGRAAVGGSALDRSVSDLVTRSGAALALEDVVDTEPVTDFVHGSQSLVVVGGITAGKRACEVDAAVEDQVGGGGVGEREVAEAEQAAAKVGKEVEVEVGVGALLEGLLHLSLGGAALAGGGPGVVDSDVDGDGVEGDAHGRVGIVHHRHLLLRHGAGVLALLGRGGHNVDVGVNRDGLGDNTLQVGSHEGLVLKGWVSTPIPL